MLSEYRTREIFKKKRMGRSRPMLVREGKSHVICSTFSQSERPFSSTGERGAFYLSLFYQIKKTHVRLRFSLSPSRHAPEYFFLDFQDILTIDSYEINVLFHCITLSVRKLLGAEIFFIHQKWGSNPQSLA